MKKRIIYLAALPIFAIGLASCSGTNYMSHDFDIVIPEKDSKATNEYNLENSEEQEQALNGSKNVYLQAQDYLYSKYKSVIITHKGSIYVADILEEGWDVKRIWDFEKNSIYAYDYSYNMENGEVSSYSRVESKIFVSEENTFTVGTEITLNNFSFGENNSKASGFVKIVTTHKENIEAHKKTQVNPYFSYGNRTSGTLYANDEFTYMYYEHSSNKINEIAIGENGLLTYMYVEYNYMSSKEKDTNKNKIEYLENSILDDKYDTNNYIQYDEREVFGSYYSSWSFKDDLYDLSIMLSNSELFRSWFTITE
ncbi:hypothetical protein EI71_01456 [Anaeroplasma bactoclasticum]|jgi:hypothetical protein|uniref:Uncharacterized protein n=1 Tax=Anaeroplasma bactoclasticum TaxID=2088 RepID=A0A397RYL7_9MOLU|nr:hypothetical protein [Anaeroplasma bactoclasticum]RIA75491.1 hypothetical protein EI71_01456 [Anaeroplasma bactoclasticum]